MIGGSGEKYLLRVVAKHADRYNHPCGSVDLLKRKICKLKEHCARIGRNLKEIEYSILIACLIGEDKVIKRWSINERNRFMVCDKQEKQRMHR